MSYVDGPKILLSDGKVMQDHTETEKTGHVEAFTTSIKSIKLLKDQLILTAGGVRLMANCMIE